jgi:hypothetical protein
LTEKILGFKKADGTLYANRARAFNIVDAAKRGRRWRRARSKHNAQPASSAEVTLCISLTNSSSTSTSFQSGSAFPRARCTIGFISAEFPSSRQVAPSVSMPTRLSILSAVAL